MKSARTADRKRENMLKLPDRIDNSAGLKPRAPGKLEQLACCPGVVEPAALYRVYGSLREKLVRDAGHRSCTRKLVTRRREQFSTLQQYRGLSGCLA